MFLKVAVNLRGELFPERSQERSQSAQTHTELVNALGIATQLRRRLRSP